MAYGSVKVDSIISSTQTVSVDDLLTGDIQDADIATSAAIAGTKISPDFGSQNVTTTGTATAAALIPSGSSVPTNGVYLPSANNVAISTNGTGRLFVDSSGNVGVGGSPLSTLDVVDSGDSIVRIRSTIGDSAYLLIQNSDTGTAGSDGVYIGIDNAENAYVYNFENTPLIFGTNNTERLRITSDGKLGLGTSSPQVKMEIVGSANDSILPNNSIFRFKTAGGNGLYMGTRSSSPFQSYIQSAFFNNNDNNNPYALLLNPEGGNVGIGTTSPTANLSVKGSTNGTSIQVEGSASSDYTYLQTTNSSGVQTQFVSNGNVDAQIRCVTNHPLAFYTNNTEKARIDSSGRLLVGTSSASSSQIFAVQGRTSDATSYANIGLRRGAAPTAANPTLAAINFCDNNENAAANIVAGFDAGTWTSGSSHPGYLMFSTTADGASSPTERMRITNAGKLYVNTTDTATQNALLNLKNSADGVWLVSCYKTNKGDVIQFLADSPSVQVGKITVSTTSTSYSTSSDYRLKENVVPLTGATDRLKLIPVHRFNFIADPDTTVDGFLAHEAQAVVPECVTGTKDEVDADGNPVYQGIDQSKLVPLLTAALQEALQKIETLEQRLDDAGIA